jgi:hypothetical protein
MLLEVPHLGTGHDGSRFCYVLAVKEGDDDGDDEEEEGEDAPKPLEGALEKK